MLNSRLSSLAEIPTMYATRMESESAATLVAWHWMIVKVFLVIFRPNLGIVAV